MLRQIGELVDFAFILEELASKYCHDNGRNTVPPIRMFKYLLLKSIFELSDVDIVERSKYDMSSSDYRRNALKRKGIRI